MPEEYRNLEAGKSVSPSAKRIPPTGIPVGLGSNKVVSPTYNVEAYVVNEFIRENFGVPFLHLETDYAESDNEQIRVRIKAYPEMRLHLPHSAAASGW